MLFYITFFLLYGSLERDDFVANLSRVVCRVSSLIETLPDDSEQNVMMWEVSNSHARRIYLIHTSFLFFLRIYRISGTFCPLFLCLPSSNGKSGAHHRSTRSETYGSSERFVQPS